LDSTPGPGPPSAATAPLVSLAGDRNAGARPEPRRIPLALRLLYTLFLAILIPYYWASYGPQNFLWFCDTANFLIAAALWTESSLLMSWAAVSVLLVQILWVIDLAAAFFFQIHPIGGTEYMFNSTIPRITRLLSLFHAAVPPILLWGLWRLGYDRRAWLYQTIWSTIILPVCYFGWGARPGFEGGINWVVGPFDRPQTKIAPLLYLGVCILAYPILLFGPSHLALRFLFGRRKAPETVTPASAL
jgi:hypothetical protein